MRRRRSPGLPVVGLVVCVAAVAFVWLDRPAGPGGRTDTVAAGAAGAALDRGTEVSVPSPAVSVPAPTLPEPPVAGPLDLPPAGLTASGMAVGRGGPVPSPTLAADALGERVPVFAGPGDAEPGEWLDNPTWEGLDVVFLVHERRGDWLRVQFAMRPNGATAWVRAADVNVRPVDYQIVVDATHLKLTLYQDHRPVFTAPVAVGKGSTPTPIGNFFVDGIVALSDATGPYGSHQVSVAAYSEVHQRFAGGIGQIALHGTNQPSLLGTPVSNGCVRMRNADIARLAGLVPTGTPVQIVA